MRARIVESRRLSNSFPFSDAQFGRQAPRLFPEKGYGIHRRADVDPRGARRVDLRHHRGRLAPVAATGRLQMVDVELHAALARDAERLVHRLEQRVALGAHVGDVRAVVRRHRLRHLDQLRRAGVRARRIDEGGRDPERAVAHRVADDGAHRVELRCRRRRGGLADGVGAHGRGAEVRADVDGVRVTADRVEPLAEAALAAEGALQARARLGVHLRDLLELLHLVVRRRGRRRLAEDDGGDALGHHARDAAVLPQHRFPRVVLDVDEARGDDVASCVDAVSRGLVAERAARCDGGDLVASDADVGVHPWVAGAVDDAAVLDHDVVLLGRATVSWYVEAREHPASASTTSASAADRSFMCVDMLRKVGWDDRVPNAMRRWLRVESRLIGAASIPSGSPARPIHVRYR